MESTFRAAPPWKPLYTLCKESVYSNSKSNKNSNKCSNNSSNCNRSTIAAGPTSKNMARVPDIIVCN